jgi:uncharacterized damage-inducible protein DinB
MMTEPVLTAVEVLKWNETTSASWRKLLAANPEILALACDIAGTSSIAGLLQHIVAVELRYAQRIAGQPETEYAEIPFDSVEAIYATHDRAMAMYRGALGGETKWEESIDFVTRRGGKLRVTRRTVLFHACFHSIRHYAQLSTLVRPHGYKTDIPGDYLFMGMQPLASS